MKEFKGKVAVVTGAASGIGRALADRSAQEGMNVVLAERGLWSRRGTVLGTIRRRCLSGPHPERGGKPFASSCRLGCLRCKSPMPSSRPFGTTSSTSSRTRN